MTGGRDPGAAAPAGEIYRRLGVEPIINGRSTFTILGGSLMPAVVLDAMRQAAECFVDLTELQVAVGRRLATLTRNEAAFVSGGAAAGLFLAAAAAMARDTPDGILRPGGRDGMPSEFVMHRAHRIPYDMAVELAGGRLVEIGTERSTDQADLAASLTSETAAVIYVPKEHLAPAVLPLDAVCRLAHEAGVPVIVDAAAQLPPAENLWRLTGQGADVALFSGGKALCGPASTGLILGRASFVERVAANAAPLQRLGRPMKAGKEDLIGILAAVEWYLGQDQAAFSSRYEAVVDHFVQWGRGRPDVVVVREPFGEAGQPTPRALIRVIGHDVAERNSLLAVLRRTPPRIDLLAGDDDGFYVAPETLQPGEEAVISRRIGVLLDGRG